MPEIRPSERGAALLMVLLLVAVMAVISATALDRLMLATRLAGNAGAMGQARQIAIAAEALATSRIEDGLAADATQTTLAGGALGRDVALPVPGGSATARVEDGSNCFNLNSLVEKRENMLVARPSAGAQFATLAVSLGVPEGDAAAIAAAATDWIDSDQSPVAGGSEDSGYSARRTGDRMMVDASELLAVRGVTPQIWARLSPFVCALPEASPSQLNVNTLGPERAPLLAMLAPGKLTLSAARAALAKRPAAGYGSTVKFWSNLDPKAVPAGEAATQIVLRSRYFRLQTHVVIDTAEIDATALIDARRPPARVVLRDWSGA